MDMNLRETWTVIHGMVVGFIFLLGFSGALYMIYSMKPQLLTAEGISKTVNGAKVYLWGLALSVWAAVFTGAWVVYPWYRAVPPDGTTDLTHFPKFLLLASESTAKWHEFGMEWKELVAFVVSYYGPQLAKRVGERRAVMIFFIFAFVATAIAGMFGAFITKAAAVR